jgi:PKD repeat protein
VPPQAALEITPSSGNAPLLVTASGAGSTDPDGSIVSYAFDFGDGTIVGPQATPTATHTYGLGAWTAVLTVTDNSGGTATDTVIVSTGTQPPVAVLSVTPDRGLAPLSVTADATGSSDPDGTVASYTFDFGDGTVVGPQASPVATHT